MEPHPELRGSPHHPAAEAAPPAVEPVPSWVPAPLGAAYRRAAPYLGALAFVAGFTWDSLTLTRVDRLLDNFILLAYLVGLGITLVLHHRAGVFRAAWPRLAARRELLDFAARWFFGGLYSAYVVLYFKSASTWPSLLFVLLLAALMLVHEFRPAARARMRVSFFCLCAFSFLLFFIPVVTGYIGPLVLPAAGALALTAAVTLGWAMERGARAGRAIFRRHLAAGALVLVPLFVLDRLEMIPPIPLALLDRGVFHDVQRTDAGYEVRYERASWPAWRREDRTFHLGDGGPAYCFSAVFAPSGVGLQVVHVWEWADPAAGWTETDSIPFQVEGGRGGGYRGYTLKRALRAGDWRVRVTTEAGRELGRCEFTAVEGAGAGVKWGSEVID